MAGNLGITLKISQYSPLLILIWGNLDVLDLFTASIYFLFSFLEIYIFRCSILRGNHDELTIMEGKYGID